MDTPRLHPDMIELVKQKVDIVDVISERVVLKKRGRDLVGLCPFHDEKTPSFSVSPAKQMYYCFGCGAGGNAIKFLMELGKQSFGEVVLDLARRYQIPLKTLAPEQHQEFQRQLSLKEQLYEILSVAVSFYQHALYQIQGKKALDYLKVQRQLQEETIKDFHLGYAPEGWETLYRYLVEQKRYPVGLVEQAGLIKSRKTGSGYYDQFRDRLMIPIFDIQGRAIAFGSRTLGKDEPKYLNSPETPLFEKGKTLFAIDRAKGSIIAGDPAVVVEGYFDVIALHSVGIKSAVASLGTAFSQDQLKQLLRYSESKQVVFNFDADKAGMKATERAMEEIAPLIYSGQVQLKILNLPEGKDADEFLKFGSNNIEIYRQLLESSPFWIDWQIQQFLQGQDLKQGDKFQQVARNMVTLLQKLESAEQRTYYLNYCALILAQKDAIRVPFIEKSLLSQLKKPISHSPQYASRKVIAKSEENTLDKSERAEWLLLLIYLHYPEYRTKIHESLDEKDLIFNVPHYRFLWQRIIEVQEKLKNPQDLISAIQDNLLTFPETKNNDINSLFDVDHENTSREILQPEEQIKKAITMLEKLSLTEYRRYCQEQRQYHCINDQNQELIQFYDREFNQTAAKLKEIDPHYEDKKA